MTLQQAQEPWLVTKSWALIHFANLKNFCCKSTKSVSLQQNQSTMSSNLFKEKLKQSTGMRLFLFLIILLISCLIGLAISTIAVFAGDNNMKISQGFLSIMMFIVPPVVYYYITRKKKPMRSLGFRKMQQPWLYLLIGATLMFVSLPITNQLANWNNAMNLGPALSKLEELLRSLEETAEATTEQLLKADSVGGLLLNLIIIALIPAIGEELTFRGLLQQSLTRRIKNPHIAILLTSAIFSFIHFQFYGFLPRMFLGILLGYLFYTSGSLWPNMVMHFLNNGSVVILYYLNNKGILNIDAEHFGETNNTWLLVASAVITIGLIVWCWITNQPQKDPIRNKSGIY